jgi:hypothetical protein
MIIYYHNVIIMTCELNEYDGSNHLIIEQDCPQETENLRKQSREDKKHVPKKKVRVPRIPRNHIWTSGRTAVTLHR